MLSKADIKFIKSLQIKKYRKQEQCFVVEGAKSVLELLNSDFETIMVVGTKSFLERLKHHSNVRYIEVLEKELDGLGEFQSNTAALAVARIKQTEKFRIQKDEFVLVLDDIRDPGNFGTIIRTADWYGITKIIASEETADFYNQKVITASMGSFTRVKIYYTALAGYLADHATGNDVAGAFLDGKDVHHHVFGTGGLVVIGNESRGISDDVEKLVTVRLTIPRYGKAESLNAAVATAVICDTIRNGKR